MISVLEFLYLAIFELALPNASNLDCFSSNISIGFHLDPNCKTIASTIENIAEAVTHARFVGTDQTSDSIVLLKVLQVNNLFLLFTTLLMLPKKCYVIKIIVYGYMNITNS